MHFGNKHDILHSHKTVLNHKILQCDAVEMTLSFSFEGIDWSGPCGKNLGWLMRGRAFVSPVFTLHIVPE